ncbi:dynein light intermediate chain-domain-containing protein [Rhodofomes roseus]|uniref:Dynein light intermediate chain-domain-containing protein n=2 Tax=Rhodofomes roseus TaxID=34475 RepID=A0ABQ8K986_9APHY|nr:dynein light intermediate chain-domain-containing protein [Rhodofomes roseus]KAH9833682.1 dynein light intermediate chain-domain-containing protein [Rhodofomes roseus]
MDNSRPSSPDAPPQDLWSSILDSVSKSRSIPAKQVLVLGQPSTGKSTLVSALLKKPPADADKEDHRSDFALGYDWADVKDDADEDILARLSIYTVPSSAASYTALLPHFLPPRASLPHTVILVVLDWTRPWTFVEELETWLEWVEKWVKGDSGRELEIVREENHERLQAYLQHYAEPTADPIPTTSTMSGTVLPLGPGTLTHNSAGVPIIVACTKADLIDENNDVLGPGTSGMGGMVKGKGGEWEERTDSIMQILRTICLKYGAGLFYTTPLPDTLQVLRQYALHLLFMPPAPSPAMAGSEAPAPVRNPFPFQHKPNALDRDRIVVPAGWDSWGKIGVLRDGFDAKTWGEALERDLDRDEGETEPGAKKLYATLVPDQGAKPPPLPPFNNPTPEQAFLARNYDENSKKPDRDPRGAFRNPNENIAAGIVGPMGSSSFTLPNVERALTEMEGIVGGGSSSLGMSTAPDGGRKHASRTSGRPPSTLAVPVSASNSRSSAASPTLSAGSPSPTGGQTQHEVLQNFFQSLLSNKDRASAAAATGRTTSPNSKSNGNASGTDEGT